MVDIFFCFCKLSSVTRLAKVRLCRVPISDTSWLHASQQMVISDASWLHTSQQMVISDVSQLHASQQMVISDV
jgi:hypothetical protein